ncbi:MAG: hypothetical protein EOL87_09695 [Spartobacteria bacterium]|nr:hypothetical protein [Spartobacteria bacterium]
MNKICIFLIMSLFSSMVMATDFSSQALDLLRQVNCVSYAEKSPYGAGIDHLWLGYDEGNKPIAGVAVRQTRTYKDVNTLVLVAREANGFTIKAAEVPDLDKLPGKAKTLVEKALVDISNKTFASANTPRGLVDSVTGATKYYQAVYVSFGLMASKIISELDADPDWIRKAL